MKNFNTITITHNKNEFKIVGVKDRLYRKSHCLFSQKSAESEVNKLHNAVKKVASYRGCELRIEDVDYYDEGICEYQVAGADIYKGNKSARDISWYKTSIPKDWTMELGAYFNKVQQVTRPINLALSAFNINLSSNDMNKLKTLLKKNGEVYIIGDIVTRDWTTYCKYTIEEELEDW